MHCQRDRLFVRVLPPALLVLCACAGCGNLNPFDEVWFPWQVVDDDYEAAPERIARYRAMGQSAASKPPAVQEQEAQKLADAFHAESDPLVRGAIALAIAHYASETASAVLLTAIRDPNVETRKAACKAWGRRGGPQAIQVLSDVLDSEEDRDVRLVAIDALGDIKDQAAVPVLARGLEDSDVAVQYRAMRSLENVTDRYYGNDVESWRQFVRGENLPSQTPSIAERFRRLVY